MLTITSRQEGDPLGTPAQSCPADSFQADRRSLPISPYWPYCRALPAPSPPPPSLSSGGQLDGSGGRDGGGGGGSGVCPAPAGGLCLAIMCTDRLYLFAEDPAADEAAGLAAVDGLVTAEAGARQEGLGAGRAPKPAACNTRGERAGLRLTDWTTQTHKLLRLTQTTQTDSDSTLGGLQTDPDSQ